MVLGLVILILAASLQVAIADASAWLHIGVDLLLVCTICAALLATPLRTVVIAIVAGIFRDALSTGHFGYSVAIFVPLGLVIQRIRGLLWVNHWTAQAGLAMAGTVASWAVFHLILAVKGAPAGLGMVSLFVGALLNACAAPLLFRIWQAVVK